MNGQLLAGTTKGVFIVDGAGSAQTLEARHVRDLVNLDGRVLAGSAGGLFTSDDEGRTWSGPQLEGRDVWQIRAASDGRLYASTEPAALFRSDDQGQSWRSLCDEVHSPSPANFHGLVPDPENVGGVLVGTDTGEVWQVSDDAQWTELGSGLPLVWSLAVA